ncbi:MAG: pseudouridylate synthase, partial [Myxococcales bacterium]|nr:pseudouridylate synthase [Myxococcales bacterium]
VQGAFARREVEKRYLALVRGIPEEAGRIDHPIPRVRKSPERVPAVTDFRRLFIFRERYALVEARPRTGRQHQVRRHFKHISCPLIGDANYGKSEHNRLFQQEFMLSRLALHAVGLGFHHPRRGEWLEIQAPLPDDLARPFERMQIPPELWL